MGLQIDDFDYLEEEKKEKSFEEIEKTKEIEKKQEEKKEEPLERTEKTEEIEEGEQIPSSRFFVVKVGVGKESACLDMISHRVKSKNLQVYSIVRPHGVKGYLFLEAEDRENAEEASFDLPYVKGILPKEISFEEMKSMIEPETKEINIEKGDIVEITVEPFKKEKAKVIRVDKLREKVVVSLLEAVIPIPVTVKIDNVRVIRREEES
ncbi:MAG: transcription elongation factor Spt5 [Candidatus Pacearchaeota archaeon]